MNEYENCLKIIKEVGCCRLGNWDGCCCSNFSIRNVDVEISCGKGREQAVWVSSRSMDYDDKELLRPIMAEVVRQVTEQSGRIGVFNQYFDPPTHRRNMKMPTTVTPIESVFTEMKYIHDAAVRAAETMYELSPINRSGTWNTLDDENKAIWTNVAKEAISAGNFILKRVEKDRLLSDLDKWIDFLEKGCELDGLENDGIRSVLIATLFASRDVIQDVERYNATVRSALIAPENYRK